MDENTQLGLLIIVHSHSRAFFCFFLVNLLYSHLCVFESTCAKLFAEPVQRGCRYCEQPAEKETLHLAEKM